ncbi:signal peptidase II [Candidatus Uhrbacteria bacterium]|nr:signal peptidase II [Candidatus Uhrbacteria bacterium]
MPTLTLKTLFFVEALFFILDVVMKRIVQFSPVLFQGSWFALERRMNSGVLAQYFSATMLVVIFIFLGIILGTLCYRTWFVRRYLMSAAFLAILLGMASTIADTIEFGTIIDWVRLGNLAFNIGDILIMGGIIAIILNAEFRIKNAE